LRLRATEIARAVLCELVLAEASFKTVAIPVEYTKACA